MGHVDENVFLNSAKVLNDFSLSVLELALADGQIQLVPKRIATETHVSLAAAGLEAVAEERVLPIDAPVIPIQVRGIFPRTDHHVDIAVIATARHALVLVVVRGNYLKAAAEFVHIGFRRD